MHSRTAAARYGVKALFSTSTAPTPNVARLYATERQIKKQFSMPAEWSRHSYTIVVWPDSYSSPDEESLQNARSEVSAIANAIGRFEPVKMYTRPENVERAKATVSGNVTVRQLEVSQLWVRDTGPIFVKNLSDGSRAGLNLGFNYWGAKQPREGDENAASKILRDMQIPCFNTAFQAEGGGIEVDGEGSLLATESAILNPNRNPGMSKAELEEHFKSCLGITKTIWLRGVKGYDVTDYYIDAFARFLAPGKVLLGRPPETSKKILIEAYEEAKESLNSGTDARGRRLEVVEIAEPLPQELPGEHWDVTVASYINYLLVNGGIIIPHFGVGKADDDALELFQRCFPNREIAQVYLNTLPKWGGGIHCATQQVPLI